MRPKSRELPEHAGQCLTCACEDELNQPARVLLAEAEALTATGVLAAIFIADSDAHASLTIRAREAIAEQRARCERDGPFRPERCIIHHR